MVLDLQEGGGSGEGHKILARLPLARIGKGQDPPFGRGLACRRHEIRRRRQKHFLDPY